MPSEDSRTASPSVWSVFLSSTVLDCQDFRREVQDVLHKKAEAACFLSEDWQGGYDDTLELCKQRIRGSQGFFLLLGYWYGSVPPGHTQSITHLEFDWAREKWGRLRFPPMAVMLPKEPSPAERKLRKAAQTLVRRGVADSALDEADHNRRLSGFRTAVMGGSAPPWRTVRTFTNEQELRENALASVLLWRGGTAVAAARQSYGDDSAPGRVGVRDDQLGRLGRKVQRDAVDALLAGIAGRPEEPGLAMACLGGEDMGQRAFLTYLASHTLATYGRKSRLHRLPVDHAHPASLPSWIARQLGVADDPLPQTPEDLAERVARELRSQSLYFVLDRVDDLAGGRAAFERHFWTRFYAHLRALRGRERSSHRVVAVVADYRVDSAAALGKLPDYDSQSLDYSKVVPLPGLQPFERRHVLQWLADLQVPDVPVGRRGQLAERALKNAHGAEDRVPTRVFDRLRSEALWPERPEDNHDE